MSLEFTLSLQLSIHFHLIFDKGRNPGQNLVFDIMLKYNILTSRIFIFKWKSSRIGETYNVITFLLACSLLWDIKIFIGLFQQLYGGGGGSECSNISVVLMAAPSTF